MPTSPCCQNRNRITTSFANLISACVLILGIVPCGKIHADELELLTAPVRVVVSSDPNIFPQSWRKAPISATGNALESSQHERVMAILKPAIAKYPQQVLATHLRDVFLLSDLRYSGVSAAGTNSRNAVYLRVGEEKRGFTKTQIEGVFHAELSSILLRNMNFKFDKTSWQKLNPPDFKYSLGDGVGAIKSGKASTRIDESQMSQGFRTQYSQSSLENDFNGFAAALFTGDAALWRSAETYPAIDGKLKLTIKFYSNVDPTFTEEFFRNLVTD